MRYHEVAEELFKGKKVTCKGVTLENVSGVMRAYGPHADMCLSVFDIASDIFYSKDWEVVEEPKFTVKAPGVYRTVDGTMVTLYREYVVCGEKTLWLGYIHNGDMEGPQDFYPDGTSYPGRNIQLVERLDTL